MKKFFYATMCVMSLFLSGCGYDDDEVWNAINDQEERIAALEEWQKTANENIAALQAIVNGNDYITSVEEIKEGDEVIGYTLVLDGERRAYGRCRWQSGMCQRKRR